MTRTAYIGHSEDQQASTTVRAARHTEPGVFERFFKGIVELLLGPVLRRQLAPLRSPAPRVLLHFGLLITHSAQYSGPQRCGSATT